MIEEVKEEFNIARAINEEKEIIMRIGAISEKILEMLRGKLPMEEENIPTENCILDTMKINKKMLCRLERNIDEIANKIMG